MCNDGQLSIHEITYHYVFNENVEGKEMVLKRNSARKNMIYEYGDSSWNGNGLWEEFTRGKPQLFRLEKGEKRGGGGQANRVEPFSKFSPFHWAARAMFSLNFRLHSRDERCVFPHSITPAEKLLFAMLVTRTHTHKHRLSNAQGFYLAM